MERDIRTSASYREALALVDDIRQPGRGQISDAAEANVSPDGQRVVFSGTLVERLEGAFPTRVCMTHLATGDTRVLTFGPNTDRSPKFAPDGRWIAFLSDREQSGDFQLYLLDLNNGSVRATARVDGWVEYFHWSPDGRLILLGVAGHGADLAGGQGAVPSKLLAENMPAWTPAIDTAEESHRWRHACMYDVADNRIRQASPVGANIWEAAWCGNDAFVAVVSPGPREGLWYSARLQRVKANTASAEELYVSPAQMGCIAASSDGKWVAVIEALCSDRGFVAGDLKLIDADTRQARAINTNGLDVSYLEWRSDGQLLLAGHSGCETVVAQLDVASGTVTRTWASQELTTGGRYATVCGIRKSEDCVLVAESFIRPPELGVIEQGRYRCVRSFDVGDGKWLPREVALQPFSWQAPDGLTIDGWLARPQGRPPHPLITYIHGGPVYQWRPRWAARMSTGITDWMLLRRGYALFYPNARGSSGRGQEFARRILGELAGAETQDHLSGLDALVKRGLADPARLGVTGVSHGGFMTAWLITQDTRFAAAVPVSPVTNHVTQQLLSNIPEFVGLFLQDRYSRSGGKYFGRSPIMHAHRVKTPTLNICGARDRCTPPEEAIQFHNALLQNGVESILVNYPEEGHGVRHFPAVLDYAARIVSWFDEHIASPGAQGAH